MFFPEIDFKTLFFILCVNCFHEFQNLLLVVFLFVCSLCLLIICFLHCFLFLRKLFFVNCFYTSGPIYLTIPFFSILLHFLLVLRFHSVRYVFTRGTLISRQEVNFILVIAMSYFLLLFLRN